MLLLVGGNGVAKLPDPFLPFFFSHVRLQTIDDGNVGRLRFVVSFRSFGHQLSYSLHVIAKELCLLLVLVGAAGVASSFGPFAHRSGLAAGLTAADRSRDLKSRVAFLAIRTPAVPNVRAVRSVDVPAMATAELVDLLAMVGSRSTGISDDDLSVRHINVSHLGRSPWTTH